MLLGIDVVIGDEVDERPRPVPQAGLVERETREGLCATEQ